MPPYKLSIVTPLLTVDAYAAELAGSLDRLRSLGLVFDHTVVSPVGEALVKAVFPQSLYVAERRGTRGVFDAVGQGFDFAIKRFNPSHLSYINGDDLLLDGFGAAVQTSQQNRGALITGEVNWIGEKGEVFGPVSIWPFTFLSRRLFEASLPPFTQQGLIFPASCWLDVGGFDQGYKYIADSIFWHKALSRGLTRRHLKKPVAGYRIRVGQLSGNRAQVNAESLQWQAGLDHGFRAKLARFFAKTCVRVYFTRRYLGRLCKGQVLRSEKAIVAGGFE
jgi:hypothetical protein